MNRRRGGNGIAYGGTMSYPLRRTFTRNTCSSKHNDHDAKIRRRFVRPEGRFALRGAFTAWLSAVVILLSVLWTRHETAQSLETTDVRLRTAASLVESSIAVTEQECVRLEISPLPFRHVSGRGFVHFGLYEVRLEPSGAPVRHFFDEGGMVFPAGARTDTGMLLARRLPAIMDSGLCVMAEGRGCGEAHFSLPLTLPEEQ